MGMMIIGKWVRIMSALIASLFLTFLPVFMPVAYAVEAWTGNSWEGESWQGNSWDGSSLQWEGESWEGNSWQGESWQGDDWEGQGTEGSSWDGNSWSSVPWYLEGWSQHGFTGDSWTGNPSSGNSWGANGWNGNGYTGDAWQSQGWNGSSYNGNAWNQSGFQGNPYTGDAWSQSGFEGSPYAGNNWSQYGYTGNPWLQPGYAGSPYAGNTWNSSGYSGSPYLVTPWLLNGYQPNVSPSNNKQSETETPYYDTNGYKVTEYIMGSVIGGQATMASEGLAYQRHIEAGSTGKWDFGGRMYGDLLVNGFKLGGVDNFVTDSYDAGTKLFDGVKGYRDFQEARNLASGADELFDVRETLNSTDNGSDLSRNGSISRILSPPEPVEKALSKLSLPAAALGAYTSGAKTVDSFNNASDVMNSNASGADKTAAAAEVGENLGDTLMNAGTITAAVPIPGARAAAGIMVAGGAGLWALSKGTKFIANNWKGGPIKTAKSIAKKGWNTVKGWFS